MVRMLDIARRAGVARPTVSLVLNNHKSAEGMRPETRERILRAAEELGYHRDEIARQVKTGKSFTLGFLAGHAHLEYSARLFSGALDEADALGYTMRRFKFDADYKDHNVITRCLEHRLAGVLVNEAEMGPLFEDMCAQFERHKLRFILLDNKVAPPQYIRVRSDDESGACEAVRHLASLGHRRITYLGGIPDVGTSVTREAGYRRAMEALGLEADMQIRWSHWLPGQTEVLVRENLTSPHPATAFVCGSDPMALLAVRAARGLGFRVPEDISVVGFGDLARMNAVDPPMTTVAVDYEGMGAIGVRLALSEEPPQETIVSTRLVVRESTAPMVVRSK